MLTQSQKEFIDKRTRLHKYWPSMVAVLALLWGGASLFFYFRFPLFANPFFVIEQLEKNRLEPTTMMLLSAMLPVIVMSVSFLLLILILLFADRMLTEKKLLKIIDILKSNH
jgi:Na+/proline symporter